MQNTPESDVSFVRVRAGHFDVFLHGQRTDWHIVNGSLGQSGMGPNTYGISRTFGPVKWIGKLSTCKKTIALSLRGQ